MWIVSTVLLLALGVLGIASWLRLRQPQVAGPLAQLEGVGGWVGLVGLVFGVLMLVQWIIGIGALAHAPIMMIIALVSALAITALSLILAMPTVKTLAGSNGFTEKLTETAAKLGPFKMILGAICVGLAVTSVLLRLI